MFYRMENRRLPIIIAQLQEIIAALNREAVDAVGVAAEGPHCPYPADMSSDQGWMSSVLVLVEAFVPEACCTCHP